MSDEILNDEQLDSVSGGIVITATKTPNTTFAATVRGDMPIAAPTTPQRTIDRTAGTAALAGLRRK